MKNLQIRFKKQTIETITRLTLVIVAFAFLSMSAFAQIATTIPASRCGEGTLVLSATAASGTIKWYDVPFYGTAVATGASFTTPSLAVTKTYYVDAVDGANCSLNSGSARVQVIATISANSIQTGIFYTSNTFCKSVSGSQDVTRTGTAGGIFTVSPTGLSLNASTGAITPGTSTNGTYTVTYTVTAAEGCSENPASTEVTITNAPVTPVISYTGSPYCTSAGPASVIQTGATGGTYSASPSGFAINAANGTISPSSSLSGTYTITYFVPGAGGCDFQSTTTTVTILQLPTATISYAGPFTKNQGGQPVTLTGTGVFTGGVFSAPGGLTIDGSTGAITPGSSTAGIYSVTYTLAAVSPCVQVTATTSVTIYPLPTATISGTISVCQNSSAPNITFTGAAGLASYTFTYNINSGPDQTISTTGDNPVTVSQPTALSGTYIYTLVNVSDANNSSQAQGGTATITVNSLPVAKFNYAGTPYCSNSSNPLPTFLESGVAGTFSSTAGLVFVSTSTGEINLVGSTAGTYTVTNTIAAAEGCSVVAAATSFTKTTLPVASFHYAGNSYCQTGTNPDVIYDGAGVAGTFTSIPAGVQFVTGNPGRIDLAATTAGTYQIVNTIVAANGCSEVVAVFDNFSVVAPPSTPSIAYSGSPYCNSVTEAQPVELTGTSGGTFTALPAGLTINASTGAVTPGTSTPGTYTVTYSVGGGSGCSAATSTASVVINETPAVTNVASYAICSGTSPNIALTASIASTFSWTLGTVSDIILDASVSTGSPTHIDQVLNNISYTDAGTVPYLVTPVSTANSCVGAPFTITVTVNPKPQLTINNPAAVCYPGTVNITAGAVTAGNSANITGFTYWTNYEATVSLSSPAAVAASGTYYIKGTTASGCSDVSEVMVTVNPLPEVPAAGNVTVTYNGSVHTGTATPPTGSTIVWYTAATGGTVTSAPSGTNAGTYTVWAESKADLIPTQCVSASRILVTVQIDKAESTIAATGTTSFTYTGSAQGPATSTVTGSTGAVTYSYSGTGSTTYSASATPPTDAGTYQVIASVAADANFNGKTSSAYSFIIIPLAPTGSAAQTFCSGI